MRKTANSAVANFKNFVTVVTGRFQENSVAIKSSLSNMKKNVLGWAGYNGESTFSKLKQEIDEIPMSSENKKSAQEAVDRAKNEVDVQISYASTVVEEALSKFETDVERISLGVERDMATVDEEKNRSMKQVKQVSDQLLSVTENLDIKSNQLSKAVETNQKLTYDKKQLDLCLEKEMEKAMALTGEISRKEKETAVALANADMNKKQMEVYSQMEHQARKERDVAMQKNKVMNKKFMNVTGVLSSVSDALMKKPAKDTLVKAMSTAEIEESQLIDEMNAMWANALTVPTTKVKVKSKASSSYDDSKSPWEQAM